MKPPTAKKDLFLERHGYLRCTFDFEHGEECLGCNRVPATGSPQYWVSTSYECDEGDYYCRRCAYDRATGRIWDSKAALMRHRPMHGAGWALLHGMKDWELILWGGMDD